MEDKEILKAQYNQKLYSEGEKDNFVREAVAQAKEDIFDVFKLQVDSLITKRLLELCNAHKEVFRDQNLNSISK